MVKIGDIVPADARILSGYLSSLEADEALLTGESLPVTKTEEPIEDPDCPLGDRTCMVYSGSQVVKGRARCLVVGTGMTSELGKIAAAMERKETRKETGFAATWVCSRTSPQLLSLIAPSLQYRFKVYVRRIKNHCCWS